MELSQSVSQSLTKGRYSADRAATNYDGYDEDVAMVLTTMVMEVTLLMLMVIATMWWQWWWRWQWPSLLLLMLTPCQCSSIVKLLAFTVRLAIWENWQNFRQIWDKIGADNNLRKFRQQFPGLIRCKRTAVQKNRERLQFNNRPFPNNLDNEDTVRRDDDVHNWSLPVCLRRNFVC